MFAPVALARPDHQLPVMEKFSAACILKCAEEHPDLGGAYDDCVQLCLEEEMAACSAACDCDATTCFEGCEQAPPGDYDACVTQ